MRSSEMMEDFSKVIMVTRSPARESLNLISAIPAGTNVLLVNASYETALETVHAFYEIGVSHINLIPYDSALTRTGIYDQITVAVTPSEPHLVPPHISQVIDIGYRKVGFDTMFKLMQLLDLDVGIINRNLQRHIYSVVEPNEGFHSNYIYGYLKSEMLSRVVDASENGMLLTDAAYQPVYANRLALKIFRADNKSQIRIAGHIPAEVLNAQDHSEEPVIIEGEAYGYEKNPIRLMDDVAGYYFILQDYAKVKAQSRSARQAGFTAKYTFKDILCKSPEMSQLIDTARQIAAAHLTRLKTLLAEASRGRCGRDMAVEIRNAARCSVGSRMPAKSLELQHTIRLIRELDAEIEEIETAIQAIMEELHSPITTIPGIGYRMGAMILAEVGDFSRFDSPDKLLAYAGMSPSTYQSGQLKNCYPHMEKRGSRYLRYALYNAAKYR